MRRVLVAGNWKMNTTSATAVALAKSLVAELAAPQAVQVTVCPPAPYLLPVGEVVRGSGVELGAQNVSAEAPGAFTGEVSLEMLKDAGCKSVILGHSERRQFYAETDAIIAKKVQAVLASGLQAILCVGELLSERQGNQTEAVLRTQLTGSLAGVQDLSNVVIAYEPVWAIGTGVTASPAQAQEAHAFLRGLVSQQFGKPAADALQILYGGSVKPDNAETLLGQPDVDGALVGGASLKADQFLPIVRAGQKVATARGQ